MSKALEKPKKYEERLMSAFAFDEDDLEANQAGHLSAHQAASLTTAQKKMLVAALIFTLMLAVSFGLLLLSRTPVPFLPLLGVSMIGASTAFFAAYEVGAYRLRSDLQEDHVLSAEGRIDLSLKTGQNKANYFLRVGGMRFAIKQQKFLALKNGDPYCVYYTRRSKNILSVEWLRDSEDNLITVETGEQTGSVMDEMPNFEPEEKTQRR